MPPLLFPKELRLKELALDLVLVSWVWAVLAIGVPIT